MLLGSYFSTFAVMFVIINITSLILAVCSQSSVLKAEVFRWVRNFDKIEDYISANTGCHSALLFPTLFGLRLAEDFELGTRFNFLSSLLFSEF